MRNSPVTIVCNVLARSTFCAPQQTSFPRLVGVSEPHTKSLRRGPTRELLDYSAGVAGVATIATGLARRPLDGRRLTAPVDQPDFTTRPAAHALTFRLTRRCGFVSAPIRSRNDQTRRCPQSLSADVAMESVAGLDAGWYATIYSPLWIRLIVGRPTPDRHLDGCHRVARA